MDEYFLSCHYGEEIENKTNHHDRFHCGLSYNTSSLYRRLHGMEILEKTQARS